MFGWKMDVQHGRNHSIVTGRQPFPCIALASFEGCYGSGHILPEIKTNVHVIRDRDLAFASCCSHVYGDRRLLRLWSQMANAVDRNYRG